MTKVMLHNYRHMVYVTGLGRIDKPRNADEMVDDLVCKTR